MYSQTNLQIFQCLAGSWLFYVQSCKLFFRLFGGKEIRSDKQIKTRFYLHYRPLNRTFALETTARLLALGNSNKFDCSPSCAPQVLRRASPESSQSCTEKEVLKS